MPDRALVRDRRPDEQQKESPMVQNQWNDAEAARHSTPLEKLVYVSRLLGSDPSLVLHGGGNTSAKDSVRNLAGDRLDVLFVKGSGWDMATIEAPGFPGVDLNYLRKLRPLAALGDIEMVNELRTHLLNAESPTPSVEALLHAFLPHRFILHSHADAIISLTNQSDGEKAVRGLFGRKLAFVPYIMPGFALAKCCADIFDADSEVEGLLLYRHGLVTFADTAAEAYSRHIEFVTLAEEEAARRARLKTTPAVARSSGPSRDRAAHFMAALRKAFIRRGFRPVLSLMDSAEAVAFCDNKRLVDAAQRGPLTPDHVIQTKRLPLAVPVGLFESGSYGNSLEGCFDRYVRDYEAYFHKQAARRDGGLRMLDPLPRVVLVPGLGVIAAGNTARQAAAIRDIYEHTVSVISLVETGGQYEALPASDIFDVEYWSLEQAKLGKRAAGAPLQGKTAIVSGAASGIGKAVSLELAAAGACVAMLDRDELRLREAEADIRSGCRSGNAVRGFPVDVTSQSAVAQCFAETAIWTGGIDIVVQNAGVFPRNQTVEEMDSSQWSLSMQVNVDGALRVMSRAMHWLRQNHDGGDILVIASKNVPAPGKQAAAYSVGKAAQTQLARVCALEGGEYGIRVNTIHPHMVFDTGIWTPEMLASRAAAYGMTVDEYRQNNLLKTGITSADVARTVRALVDGSFAKTTGAQIPVDGGSERTL
ncbi:MAG: bifunctional aldolase/short-chain dehydrogenase [Deltaproteobacteria bacterium]|nr:bifunctional aldolase/short-chain dehydrogenase [Deltaproteobacteria bacterium]